MLARQDRPHQRAARRAEQRFPRREAGLGPVRPAASVQHHRVPWPTADAAPAPSSPDETTTQPPRISGSVATVNRNRLAARWSAADDNRPPRDHDKLAEQVGGYLLATRTGIHR